MTTEIQGASGAIDERQMTAFLGQALEARP